MSKSELALIGISATSQVIGSALAGGWVIDTFSGLVEGDEGGLAKNISHESHGLDEIQGGTGVHSTSGVIPGLNTSACGHRFGNGNSFMFTATDAADKRIANESWCGRGNVEYVERKVSDFVDERLTLNTWKASFGTGSLSSQGEIQCLGDC